MTSKKLFKKLKKVEKIGLVFLSILLIFSAYRLGEAFYLDNTEQEFIVGGDYTEGSVGSVDTLNPLFVNQGGVSSDLVNLIFSGLTRFDTQTGAIVGDLSTFSVSEDGKTYTFIIKDGAMWHDGTLVTANDVIFTYEEVIKSPEFNGAILNYNDLSGIKVTKVDERTVEFLLEKPDAFFLTKTMTPILPRHTLEKVPINALESSPFSFQPIGSGPYQFVSKTLFPTHEEYGLEHFPNYHGDKPNINTLLIKVFPDFESLEKQLETLDGIRFIPQENVADLSKKKYLVFDEYELPQYVALFMNNDAEKLKDVDVRFGLQLGTDKQAIVDQLGYEQIIDTPLLEIDKENWVNQYSVKKANGALYRTVWQIPNKEALELTGQNLEDVLGEPTGTAEVTNITTPNDGEDWMTSIEPITISGSVPEGTEKIWINEYELTLFEPGDTAWNYEASNRFDSIESGKNVFEVYIGSSEEDRVLIDAITIYFEDDVQVADSDDKSRVDMENDQASNLPIRENRNGEPLKLRLLTSDSPVEYRQVAELIQVQWQKIGVDLQIEALSGTAFQERVTNRDYDVLLFGQNLGYNLDAYPYWHSSQANENGVNLSQFKNFEVDILLEKARLDSEEDRQDTLNEIQSIISQEVPAIFLYSPTYHSAVSINVSYPPFKYLATTSDRIASVNTWYAKANRHFKEEVGVLTFFGWMAKQF